MIHSLCIRAWEWSTLVVLLLVIRIIHDNIKIRTRFAHVIERTPKKETGSQMGRNEVRVRQKSTR